MKSKFLKKSERKIKKTIKKVEDTIDKPKPDPKKVYDKVKLQDKDVEQPKQEAEVCLCCKNDCTCCDHPSGTVGHRCLCRCHS